MILTYLLIALEALISLLLIGIILIQKSRGEGLGLAFGSSMGEAIFGSRAGNVLTRATIILAALFLANTLVLAISFSGHSEKSLMAKYAGAPQQQPVAGPMGQPPAGGGQPAAMPPPGSDREVPTLPGATLDDTAPAPASAEPAAGGQTIPFNPETVAEPMPAAPAPAAAAEPAAPPAAPVAPAQ